MSKKNKIGLENQLFTWREWDEDGPLRAQFYQVELLVPIAEFPVGHKFPIAFFNGDDSNVSFMDENNVEHVYELILTVGKKLVDQKDNNYVKA